MKAQSMPYIDETTARQWAEAAADSMRSLTNKSRAALIRKLTEAILSDGQRTLPTGAIVYFESERKLHTQLAVQRLAASLLAAAWKIKGNWELGAWNMFSPPVLWQMNLSQGAAS